MSIKRDVLLTGGASAVQLVLGLVFVKMAATQFSESEFGEILLVRRVVTHVFPILMLGLNTGLVRFLAESAESDQRRGVVRVALGFIPWWAGIAVLMMAWAGPSFSLFLLGYTVQVPAMFGAFVFAVIFASFAYALLRGRGEIQRANLILILTFGLCPVVALVPLFFMSLSPSGCLLLQSVLMVTIVAYPVWRAVKSTHQSGSEPQARTLLRREMITYGVPRSITPLVMGGLYVGSCVWMNRHGLQHASAAFLVAVFIVRLVEQALGPVAVVMLPKLSAEHGRGNTEFVRGYLEKAAHCVIPLSLVLTALVALNAEWLVALFVSGEIEGAVATLRVLAVSIPFVLGFSILQTCVDAVFVRPLAMLSALAGGGGTLGLIGVVDPADAVSAGWIFVGSIAIVGISLASQTITRLQLKWRTKRGLPLVGLTVLAGAFTTGAILLEPAVGVGLAASAAFLVVFVLISWRARLDWLGELKLLLRQMNLARA